jgi:pimeloyl-ACP methyl ester carboxylesterase
VSERIVKTNSVEIFTESFGDAKNPAILLIMGATASMLWWDTEFCRNLAAEGFFVVRYDNRDVGASTAYEAGTNNYTIEDLAGDGFSILDDYTIEKAHLVGMSLGGLIAQIMILQNPERITTATLISTTIFGEDNPEIPSIDEKILEYFGKVETVDWSDEKSATDFIVGNWRLQSGTRHEFDEKRAEKLAKAEIERAKNLPAMFNHSLLGGGKQYYDRTDEIKTPVLIVHGTKDPVNSYQHAKIAAEKIQNSKLLTLENAGHEINPSDWDEIIEAISAHAKENEKGKL